MRIPNKFNGYLFDGTRNLHDPMTVAAGSTLMAPGVAAGAGGAAAAGAMGIGALGTGVATGALLAGGGSLLGGLGAGSGALSTGLGGIAPSLAAEIAPAAIAQSVGATSPALAQSLGLDAVKQQVVSQGVNNAAANQAATLAGQYNPAQAELLSKQFSANLPPVAQNANYLRTLTAGEGVAPVDVLSATNINNQAAIDAARLQSEAAAKTAQAVVKPPPPSPIVKDANFAENAINLFKNPSMQGAKDYAYEHPYVTSAGVGLAAKELFTPPKAAQAPKQKSYIRPYSLNAQNTSGQPYDPSSSAERNQLTYTYTPGEIYEAGGEPVKRAVGGPVEEMSAQNALGANQMYPQSQLQTDMYSNPMMQRPVNNNVITGGMDAPVNAYTGEARFAAGGDTSYKYSYDPTNQKFTETSQFTPKAVEQQRPAGAMGYISGIATPQTPPPPAVRTMGGIDQAFVPSGQPSQSAQQGYQPYSQPALNVPAYQTPEQQLGLDGFYDYMDQQLGGMRGQQGYAGGGMTQGQLGSYSDGGRLLKGPGDGVSDSIPAVIGKRQPARLADGEFVVPARIVSELGNGSTEAGARKLYAMMDRIQKGRKKSVGKNKVAVNSKSDKHLPA
jgi:hypothetical protein